MESYDPEIAARVWQRVRAREPEPTGDDLAGLIAQVQQQAAIYQSLSKYSPMLKALAAEKQSQTACLKGIHVLTVSRGSTPHHQQPPKEPLHTALRRCFSGENQILTQYELRTADRRFGAAFSELAKEQRRHCRMLLELIGRLER